MKHIDLKTWKELHDEELFIGSKVRVSPACEHYEAQYDRFTDYTVCMMYVDGGGLNIGLDDGTNLSYLCEADGYYISDLLPVKPQDETND